MDRFVYFVHARGRDAGTLGVAAALHRRVLRRHVHHSLGYLPTALLLARLAQATGSYLLVPHRGQRALGRYDAHAVSALPVVAEMEFERDVIPPGAWLGALRRLGGGWDVGCGEDGMGKAAARRSPISPGSRGQEGGRCSATLGGGGTVSVRAQPPLRRGLVPDLGRGPAHPQLGSNVACRPLCGPARPATALG